MFHICAELSMGVGPGWHAAHHDAHVSALLLPDRALPDCDACSAYELIEQEHDNVSRLV